MYKQGNLKTPNKLQGNTDNKKVMSACTSLVAYEARAGPCLCSMKWLGVFLLPLYEMLVHNRVTPQH